MTKSKPWILFCAALALAACSDDTTKRSDAASDLRRDSISLDQGVDLPPDLPGDSSPDTGVDLAPDISPDISPDSTPDLGQDSSADLSLLADQGLLTPLDSVATCNPSVANQPIGASVYYFRVAQTFTAQKGGELEAIDFSFDSEGDVVNQEMQLRETATNGAPTGALLAARPVKGYFIHSVVHRLDFSSANVTLNQGKTYALVLIDKNPSSGQGKRLQWWGRSSCTASGAIAVYKSLNQQALVWGTPTTNAAMSFNVGIKTVSFDGGADQSVADAGVDSATVDAAVDAGTTSWDLVMISYDAYVHLNKSTGISISSQSGVGVSSLLSWDGYRKRLLQVTNAASTTITGRNPCTGVIDTTGTPGTITIAGKTIKTIAGVAVDPQSGTIYAAMSLDGSTNAESLVTIDQATGVGTVVGAFTGHQNGIDALFFAGGQLYGVDRYTPTPVNTRIYTINTTTAACTLVSTVSPAQGLNTVAYDPSTSTLFATVYATDKLYSVNVATGALTLIGPATNGPPIAVIERSCP